MRLLIVGPPGAGKGSQAVGLAQLLGVPAISTGDLFRAHVRGETPLGLQVQSIMAAGQYVPDSITNEMVRLRLEEADAREGFLLDGYPRTRDQVIELERMLGERSLGLEGVIHLTVPTATLIARLAGRAAEEGRADDTPEAIRTRLEVYESLTAPILDVYRERGVVHDIDGVGTREEVAARVLAALGVRAG